MLNNICLNAKMTKGRSRSAETGFFAGPAKWRGEEEEGGGEGRKTGSRRSPLNARGPSQNRSLTDGAQSWANGTRWRRKRMGENRPIGALLALTEQWRRGEDWAEPEWVTPSLDYSQGFLSGSRKSMRTRGHSERREDGRKGIRDEMSMRYLRNNRQTGTCRSKSRWRHAIHSRTGNAVR